MKALFIPAVLAGLLVGMPALAAPSPSPEPQSLPIRGVTVDLQKSERSNDMGGASHIEAPPFMAAPRQMRLAPDTALEAAPRPLGKQMAQPASQRGRGVAPSPSPSPSPTPRR